MVMINSLVQCFKDTGNTQFDELFSLILHLGVVLKNNIIELQENECSWNIVIKFERMQFHFLSDFFSAVVILIFVGF